jgi:Sec-independent protein translocase protein TatA
MITAGLFFLLLGLIVFGPKKTVELAQSMGHILAQVKHAAGQLQAPEEMSIPDKPAGIGLAGMREHVADLGGELQVRSHNKGLLTKL